MGDKEYIMIALKCKFLYFNIYQKNVDNRRNQSYNVIINN